MPSVYVDLAKNHFFYQVFFQHAPTVIDASKDCLLVLHGGLGALDHQVELDAWMPFSDMLQVIFLDLRGCGQSGGRDQDHWSMEEFGDDIYHFCNHFGIKPIVAGISSGGYVIQSYATRHPEQALALILANTEAVVDRDAKAAAFASLIGKDGSPRLEREKAAEVSSKLDDFGLSAETSNEQWQNICQDFGRYCVPLLSYNLFTFLAPHGGINNRMKKQFANGYNKFDFRKDLEKINCPVLWLAGRWDPLHPWQGGRDSAALIDDDICTFKLLETGDPVNLDNPKDFQETVKDFLAQTCLKRQLPLLSAKTQTYLDGFKDLLKTPFDITLSIAAYREAAAGFKQMASEVEEGVKIFKQSLPLGQNGALLESKVFIPVAADDTALLPTVIFFPGGGFIANLDCHDCPCSKISKHAQVRVIQVYCRLAPEFPYPYGQNDAISAVSYFFDNAHKYGIDRQGFFIAGDSSGGTFAAQTALCLRDTRKDILLKAVFLINPTTDFSLQFAGDDAKDSLKEADFAKLDCAQHGLLPYLFGLYLTANKKAPYWGIDNDRDQKKAMKASPLYAKSHQDLPPHYIWVAEFDMLRRHAGAYYRRLKQAGVMANIFVGKGQVHAYFMARGVLDDGPDPAIEIANIIAHS